LFLKVDIRFHPVVTKENSGGFLVGSGVLMVYVSTGLALVDFGWLGQALAVFLEAVCVRFCSGSSRAFL
jgi:hypothetical protein